MIFGSAYRAPFVVIDCATMRVSRWVGRQCTHAGYRMEIREEDHFSRGEIMGVIEDFRLRPNRVIVADEPQVA